MEIHNYSHGKFFGPSQSYMGYVFIACGIFATTYSLTALFLLIPGFFMAFTYTGTILDLEKKRVKSYTSHFGFIRTGKWIAISEFTRFNIKKVTSKYSSISRGGVRFDMDASDIRLFLLNHDGTKKIVLRKFNNFEEAQKAKDELSPLIFPATV